MLTYADVSCEVVRQVRRLQEESERLAETLEEERVDTAAERARARYAYVRIRPHTSAYVSIRQHTSAYMARARSAAVRQRTPAYASTRQHTSAHVSIRQHTPGYASIRQHTPAYASIRQHTPAYASNLARARSTAVSTRFSSSVFRTYADAF
jgi:hypothetical protein